MVSTKAWCFLRSRFKWMPPHMEGSCECIEFALVDSRQGDGPSALALGVTCCEMLYKAAAFLRMIWEDKINGSWREI